MLENVALFSTKREREGENMPRVPTFFVWDCLYTSDSCLLELYISLLDTFLNARVVPIHHFRNKKKPGASLFRY